MSTTEEDVVFLGVYKSTTNNLDNAACPDEDISQQKERNSSMVVLGTPSEENLSHRKERAPSVVVLGTPQKSRCESDEESPDPNGLIVTYSRPADTVNFPHPRSACPYHPFSIADSIFRGPYMQNESCCERCYCYVCDKPAKECGRWGDSWRAHCNAYRKNSVWQRVRNVYNEL